MYVPTLTQYIHRYVPHIPMYIRQLGPSYDKIVRNIEVCTQLGPVQQRQLTKETRMRFEPTISSLAVRRCDQQIFFYNSAFVLATERTQVCGGRPQTG
jgi:hypothetical protein